ncbi:MAG: alkyl sulfatase dimerization domain-containing protein [Acidimicrobiales bacterium]
MAQPDHGIERIDNSLDWFESNATGGGATSLPFREVADGMWLQDIQYGTGNALTVDTGDSLLQLDTGIAPDHAKGMIAAVRGVSDKPVSTIVYSHGHTAYNHGVVAWLAEAETRGDPRPTIVAHRNVLHRLQRYRETQEYLERVTEWQFGFPINSIVGTHMFEILVDPDVTYIDDMMLETSGRRVQLIHCHAETDDGTGLWFPDEKILYGANATIGSFPNIGSPLRSPRDPRAWADQLDTYLELEPEMLIREYGPEVVGADNVKEMLTTVRDALRWLRAETLARMNAGMVIEDVVNDIEYPEKFANSPWMPQSYGCAEYVIREVWRIEAGWWDRNITSVHPASIDASTSAVLDAITDKATVLAAARRHLADGEPQLALHVVDLLAMARVDTPEVAEAKELKAEIAAVMAQNSPTYMSTNYYQSVAAGHPAR